MLRLPQSRKEWGDVSVALREWLIALGTVLAALVVGWAIDALAVTLLNHDAGPAQRVRSSIARALRGQPEIWAVLLVMAVGRPFDAIATRQLAWLDRLTILLAVLSVTLFVARLSGWLIRAYLSKDTVDAPSGSIFVNLTRLLIWAVGMTFMLAALRVEVGPLVASLGVVGLAVSLGLQDTLANFFSGLQITLSRQIQPGDFIRLSTAEEGTVVDVTWRNTTLRAPSNDLVIVPNSIIARSQVTNFTVDSEEHVLTVPFFVHPSSNLDTVKHIATAVASDVRDSAEGAIRDFEPAVRYRGFTADGNVSAVVTMRVDRYQDRAPIVSELVQRLTQRLAEEGVGLGSPPAAGAK
jgi:small-conductance mechanosensitive channel